MKAVKSIFGRSLATLVVCLAAPIATTAATIAVPSLSESSLLYYSQHVSDGDTLVFPAGKIAVTNATQVTSSIYAAVVWTNAVTLKFTAPTVITNLMPTANAGKSYIFRFSAPTNAGVSRLSGAAFDGNRLAGGVSVGKDQTLRLDNCSFTDMYARGVFFWGYRAYGLVDHCTFTNNRIAVEVDGGDNASWNETAGLGTTNAVVVEDCYFFNDSSGVPVDQLFYNGQGARVVFRHNSVKSTSTNNVWFWDSHGNCRYLPLEARGTISTVLENNYIDIKKVPKAIIMRGGMFMMISNTLVCPGAFGMTLTEEEGWSTSLFPTLRTNWPAQDQVTNTWVVNNTLNGAPITATNIMSWTLKSQPNDRTFIQEGRDFWVTNAMPPLVNFTPLAYPHPRVTDEDSKPSPWLANLRLKPGGGQ